MGTNGKNPQKLNDSITSWVYFLSGIVNARLRPRSAILSIIVFLSIRRLWGFRSLCHSRWETWICKLQIQFPLRERECTCAIHHGHGRMLHPCRVGTSNSAHIKHNPILRKISNIPCQSIKKNITTATTKEDSHGEAHYIAKTKGAINGSSGPESFISWFYRDP